MEDNRDKGKEKEDSMEVEATEEKETENQELLPKDNPKFRINAQNLFLTYSKCPLPMEYLKERLMQLLPVSKYIVAHELHKNGLSHLHAYLRLEKKIDRNDPRFLDIDGFHPNIRSCRSPKAVQTYCTKEGNYITNMDFYIGSPYRDATEMARQGDLRGAMTLLDTLKPRDMVIYGSRIRQHLLDQRRQHAKRKSYYSMEDYDVENLPVWDKNKALILTGLTGSGKTQLAKLLIGDHYHLVCHLDGVKNFNEGVHDGIIFDDMSYLHLPRESQIHLVDVLDDREIHARHCNGFLPAGTARIMTTNKPLEKILLMDDAIVRRLQVWSVIKIQDKEPGDGQKIEVVEQVHEGLGTIDTPPPQKNYRWN
jgi:hypothetical protein